jgi:hypothetical protein
MSAVADNASAVQRAVGQAASAASAELRANPRARMGLAVIGLIILVAIGLRLADHVQRRQSEISTLRVSERELLSLTSKAQADAWADADAKVAALLERARARLWSRGPVGAAHADFYTWIEQSLVASGVNGAQVRLGEARKIGVEGQLTELRVSVFVPSAPSPPSQEAVYTFLRSLSDNQKLIHARSLRLKFEPAILLEGEFVAYVTTEVARRPSTETTGGSQAKERFVTP